ncbi:hypothetical protein, partial [Enterobacter pasteurii]|uniref:hypothetical protein n=1 Tax=Enterobacter pasteurii TaxID=3029761 RepID=UPI00238034B2
MNFTSPAGPMFAALPAASVTFQPAFAAVATSSSWSILTASLPSTPSSTPLIRPLSFTVILPNFGASARVMFRFPAA